MPQQGVKILSFKIMRKRAGLTQREVSEALGIPQSTVACWETNRALPRADKLPILAKFLGCTIDELLMSDVPDES